MRKRKLTDWAKVAELREQWNILAKETQIAANAVASSRFASKGVQRAALERYEQVYLAEDAVYAEMMLEMGDLTYAAQYEKRTREREEAAARRDRIEEYRKEWGIFAPLVDKCLGKGP